MKYEKYRPDVSGKNEVVIQFSKVRSFLEDFKQLSGSNLNQEIHYRKF